MHVNRFFPVILDMVQVIMTEIMTIAIVNIVLVLGLASTLAQCRARDQTE